MAPYQPVAAGPADLRDLMTTFPTGVAVVTALGADGLPRGTTCTSMCSVSLEPPTLLVCLREGGSTLTAVLARDAFAVNLVHEDARWAAELFASGRPDRFDGIRWAMDAGAAGPHLADHAHAAADCAVIGCEPVGDHRVVFGRVSRIAVRPEPRPLLYGFRRFAAWSGR